MIKDPMAYFSGSYTRMQRTDPERLREMQLHALRVRFGQLRGRIPTLTRIADHARIEHIGQVDDVVPRLFDHTVYKSYASPLIDQKEFGKLPQWLAKLTSHNLSAVDANRCHSLDDWLDELDSRTELRLIHTSGTTGKLSFLPWARSELDTFVSLMGSVYSQTFGQDEDWRMRPGFDVVFPYFRKGAASACRPNESSERVIAEDPSRFHTHYPARLIADLMYLSARLRAAAAKGATGSVKVDPDLLKRKAQLDEQLAAIPERVNALITGQAEELAGKLIWTFATSAMLYQMADAGLKKGYRRVFAPESVVVAAGGAKGWTPPKGLKERILEFFGADRLRMAYGMSEISLVCQLCEHGHYHLSPWVIPFVLDLDSGQPAQRRRHRTRRLLRSVDRNALGRIHYRRRSHDPLGRTLYLRADLDLFRWRYPARQREARR